MEHSNTLKLYKLRYNIHDTTGKLDLKKPFDAKTYLWNTTYPTTLTYQPLK